MRTLADRLMARYPASIQHGRDLVLVPALGLVVCFISKNASTFLKTYIASLARGTPLRRPDRNPHLLLHTGFKGIEELGPRRFSEILSDTSIPKVTVGREPVRRLVSAYRTRVRTWQRERYDSGERAEWVELRQAVLGTAHGRHAARPIEALSTEIGWRTLVDHVAGTPSGLLDRHLVPQTDYAAVDELSYDLVGNVEAIDEFLRSLCRLVDRPFLDPRGLRLNAAAAGTDAGPDITPAQRSALRRRYEADYRYFGYAA